MIFRKSSFLIPIILGGLVIASLIFLWPATQASAQCGSQASSCKNCHEVQGQKSVNSDGTAWHSQHQQIDACVSCHAGNPQSTDKTQAHTGIVPWNSDVKAGCASCHPSDYLPKAQIYAATLKVTLGGASTAPGNNPQPTGSAAAPLAPAATAAPVAMVASEPGTVDYVQQYNETVLNQHPINWGNVIVGLMIVAILFGGGAFVYWNERHLRGLTGFFTPAALTPQKAIEAPVVEGYSSEVTALLPLIAQLNPIGLHSLQRILAHPDQANEMLHALAHLDPELVHRVQALDKDSRALLMALSER